MSEMNTTYDWCVNMQGVQEMLNVNITIPNTIQYPLFDVLTKY